MIHPWIIHPSSAYTKFIEYLVRYMVHLRWLCPEDATLDINSLNQLGCPTEKKDERTLDLDPVVVGSLVFSEHKFWLYYFLVLHSGL